LEKILSTNIAVNDQEIKDYIAANSKYLPTDLTQDALNAQVKDQLIQQKLSQEYQTWITDVKGKAKILYFVNY
jgi:hypothetical protein